MSPEPPDKHRSIKQSVKNVVRDPATQQSILDIVHASHRITVHALQFLKLYLLDQFERGTMIPMLTESLVVSIINVLCEESESKEPTARGKATTIQLKQDLLAFHRNHYKPTMADPEVKLGFTNKTQMMQYIAVDVVKDYENNLKLHFVQHLDRFLNVLYDKSEVVATKNKEACTKVFAEIRAAREFVLYQPEATRKRARLEAQVETSQIPSALVEHLPHLVPQRPFRRGNVYFDIQCSPQDYLPCLIYMMRWVEARGERIPNVFPMRSSIIPKYVRFDTKLVIQLLLPKDTALGVPYKLLKDVTGNKEAVWGNVFQLDQKCFAPKESNPYEFGYTIQTDGIACSILWVERGAGETKKIQLALKRELSALPKELKRARPEPTAKEKKAKKEEQYVKPTESTKRVVGIDPGKSDLIYCSSGEGKDDWFRYTQNQKRAETGEKKHRRARMRMAKTLIDGKTVAAWEAELSLFDRKSLTIESAKAYFTKKNAVNAKLFKHYEERAYRVLKWRAFVNRRRSEDRMVNRFRAKFGKKDEVVLGWGDWSRTGMKFLEPTKGVGMRKLFTRAGYEVLLVKEFRTSCTCYGCQGGACEKFKYVKNPRPFRSEKRPRVLRHGLLSCKNCKRLWNRDRNGSLNIRRCAMAAMRGEERPAYLERNSSGARSAATTQGAGLPTTRQNDSF